jgi:pimeloyl-ACP methyl ester carboxylesterase
VSSLDVRPFTLDIPEADLDDLRERLSRTRWPERETVDDWSQGVPLAYLQEVCEYWQHRYDWRRCEKRLNDLGQFQAEIDGLDIHFLHVRSPHADALPLVLTHGWPGSVIEFLDVIGPLTDPTSYGGDAADAFHVVVPSLPGYGYSGKPARTGWNIQRIARAWATLMAGLGYDRYGAQGGDWGAMVTSSIGQQDREHVAGVHLNMAIAAPDPLDNLTEQEQRALASMADYDRWGSGYSKQQSTRPQSLGYGLVDSPAGQCGWIIEKFLAWTDCNGHPENVLTKDQMLDNIMLYWLPATGASSARLYWESFSSPNMEAVEVPSGVSVFPYDIIQLSERWARNRFTDLRYYHALEKGGHFAAFEQPAIFTDEVRAFFRTVR